MPSPRLEKRSGLILEETQSSMPSASSSPCKSEEGREGRRQQTKNTPYSGGKIVKKVLFTVRALKSLAVVEKRRGLIHLSYEKTKFVVKYASFHHGNQERGKGMYSFKRRIYVCCIMGIVWLL